MRLLILGAGGIGSYFGTKLINTGYEVSFVARGKSLKALQQNKLKLQHPDFFFEENVFSYSIDAINKYNVNNFDAALSTKSTSTIPFANSLKQLFAKGKKNPYVIFSQNKEDNEKNLSIDLDETCIIAGLTKEIATNLVSPAFFEFNYKKF